MGTSLLLIFILGCVLTVNCQLPPMLESLMANPSMAMAMMNGMGGPSPNPLMSMINPMVGAAESSPLGDMANMAMLNDMMSGGQGNGGAPSMASVFGTQTENRTANGLPMGMPSMNGMQGGAPNMNDIVQMMMISGGGTPSSDTLSRMAAMMALGRSNTRVLNPNLSPSKMMDLTREGVGVSPVLARQICPPQRCPFPLPCENPVVHYKPETYFVCPECPKCPIQIMMGASSLMNGGGVMGMMGGRRNPMMPPGGRSMGRRRGPLQNQQSMTRSPSAGPSQMGSGPMRSLRMRIPSMGASQMGRNATATAA